jgi:hypothetical protein
LTGFLGDYPTAGFVFLFQNTDEDRGQLDFVFTVIFPFRKGFLVLVVLSLNVMICFDYSLFSPHEV